ncbi:MAG TPA: PP2C family protein-serine/threonine phosphatase [Terracidiphilus sp.]|nr:PP2C family protein-serine/threonine phosphatase [Terracidiphilus sp.]
MAGVLACGSLAPAQPASQSASLSDSPAEPRSTEHVILGQSVVPLYGPWKFTIGDSPIDPKTNKPLWAGPEFDDSKWETVNLTPKTGAVDPVDGEPGYVPGWTAKGHPGYWGYAWYRIRVQMRVSPGQGLALLGPADVDDAYQVFDNGKLAGEFGVFSGSKPKVYFTLPQKFILDEQGSRDTWFSADKFETLQRGPAETTRVLSFRLWMEPSTLISVPDAGGMHSPPVLGDADAVAARYQLRWLSLIRAHASNAVQAALFGLLAAVAFSLILFDRSDHVYLWMGALFLLFAAFFAVVIIGSWTELLSIPVINLLTDGLTVPLIYAAWIMVWRIWFGQHRPAWLPRLTAGMTLLLMASTILGEEIFFGLVPHAVAVHFMTVSLVLQLLFFALLLWVVVEGIRRQGLEGWLVLPVALLRGIDAFAVQITLLHVRMIWFPFGVTVYAVQVSSLLVAVVIALLLLRRLLKSVKRQRLMALDVKQAQEVQQVILPEARLVLPGLTIESEYRPAREVGGDFFQIIPNKTDGSLLIVAGDVTGKGLKAGMLVALLVGAIRTQAQHEFDPLGMLKTLNERLLGRNDAQATCLALRIASDGAVTLANGGHIAPYLNSEPIAMEGALPLGMMKGAEFSLMHFQLIPNDKLMLMSDGIVEATDAEGHLFGFERVSQLLLEAKSATEIANAAQSFGQEDDISVISVTRNLVYEPQLV